MPALTNAKLGQDTMLLCYEAFALLHSGLSRSPVYAAERLTRASVAAARDVERADAFRAEDSLPPGHRAELEDYVRSGYDRGHMAPAGDMPTQEAQAESFTLANVVPQNRNANRSLWAGIEESVRRLATTRGEVFVVTGPVFAQARPRSLNGRVLVPSHLYKAVYDPRRRRAAAYLAPNADEGTWKALSPAELRTFAGVDVFPFLSEPEKIEALPLPDPLPSTHGRRREPSFADWMRDALHRILRDLWRTFVRSIF